MCQVHFRIGFLPNFETGTEEWTDSAELISVDRTNVKVIGSSWSIVVWFGSSFTFIGSNQLIDQMTNLKLWLNDQCYGNVCGSIFLTFVFDDRTTVALVL